MSNPTGGDVVKSWVLIVSAAAFALALGFCRSARGQSPKICDPADPTKCSQGLLQNDPAPFAGMLLTTRLAIDQATKAHDCAEVTELAVGQAGERLQLKLDREIALRAIDLRSAGAREDVLKTALQSARDAAERRWWEDPRVWFTVGVIVGVAATSAAIYVGTEIVKANQ